MHQNWGLITQILKENRVEINKLIVKVKHKYNGDGKKEKISIEDGETLTGSTFFLSVLDSGECLFDDTVIHYAIKNCKLSRDVVDDWSYMWKDIEDIEGDDDEFNNNVIKERFNILRQTTLDTLGVSNNHYLPLYWIPGDAHHSYQLLVCMFLAKQLMPDGDWMVYSTKYHTTLYNDTYKLFFDLIVWGQLNGESSTYNMLFGNEYKPASDAAFILELQRWLKQHVY
jgi:hypothetical protein